MVGLLFFRHSTESLSKKDFKEGNPTVDHMTCFVISYVDMLRRALKRRPLRHMDSSQYMLIWFRHRPATTKVLKRYWPASWLIFYTRRSRSSFQFLSIGFTKKTAHWNALSLIVTDPPFLLAWTYYGGVFVQRLHKHFDRFHYMLY